MLAQTGRGYFDSTEVVPCTCSGCVQWLNSSAAPSPDRNARQGRHRHPGGTRPLLLLLILLASLLIGCTGANPSSDRSSRRRVAPHGVDSPAPVRLTDAAKSLAGRLVFSAAGRIWMAEGGTLKPLTEGPNDAQPTWDREGKHVLFVRRHGDYSDLYSVVPGGRGQRLLSNEGNGKPSTRRYVKSASWAFNPSPGRGKSIVLLSDRGGALRVVRYTPGKDGGIRTLAGGDGIVADPQVSPDGATLAYLDHSGGSGQIRLVPLVSDAPSRDLTEFKGPSGHTGVYDPAWAADGKSLYFSAGTGASADLYVLQVESIDHGGKARKLSGGDVALRQPAAGGDGRIVYLKRDGETWNICTARVALKGGKPALEDEQQLTEGEGLDPSSNLSWHP